MEAPLRMLPKLLVALLVLSTALGGCLSGDAPAEDGAANETLAADGSVAGPAPVAPKGEYAVEAEGAASAATAYPLPFPTNPAKEPVTEEFEGAFQPQECTPNGQLPLNGAGLATGGRGYSLADYFEVGDVFRYEIELRFTNTDASWAEIHMGYSIGSAGDFWRDPTGDVRGEVVLNFTGQSFRASEEDPAGAFVVCWYGQMTAPIPYTLTVRFTFAEGAVPSQTPVLVSAPEGATRLFVRGVPLDASQGTPSHFRVFRPDDTLLCECALSSDEEVAAVALEGAGDYVVLVDHTANGFVSLALDAPPQGDLRVLPTDVSIYQLFASDGEQAVDEVVSLDFPSVPLVMGAWVFPPGAAQMEGVNAGTGTAYRLTVTNARGDVLRQAMGGFASYYAGVPGAFGFGEWIPLPTEGEWEFFQDHHAYAQGAHEVRVQAESFRGEVTLFARHYVRT